MKGATSREDFRSIGKRAGDSNKKKYEQEIDVRVQIDRKSGDLTPSVAG